MPALVFLKRKWLIACDDLVIPFAIEAIIRLMWLSVSIGIMSSPIKNCTESEFLNLFLYVVLGNLFITSIISLAISLHSSRGSVLEVEKRKSVPKLLYVKLATVIFEIGIASVGIWFFTQMKNTCDIKEIYVKVVVVTAWFYIFISFVSIAVCHNSFGSSKYWENNTSDSLNFFKKAKYIWRLRLRLFCCCADIGEEKDFIYVEISSFLASFLNGFDLVPSDILAGIITLSHKHFLERRNPQFNVKNIPASITWIEQKPCPDWMTPENALYFLRIAKSTYGWMAFFNAVRPWYLCTLFPYMKLNVSCCFKENNLKLDNCCSSNFAGVKKITGFSDSDILYASFKNSICEPAFYVAVNHDRMCVIIAIRGTRSFSDLVTDIDAELLPFPCEGEPKYKCHRGVLRSAMFIQKKIDDLLDAYFKEYASYNLVITGHSLGGSIASVLSLLFKPRYSNLQCYAFGPMAVLSPLGVQESLDTTFTIVVGDDMAPRLCADAGKHLRKEIFDSLKENKSPKYKLLLSACWYHVIKYFKLEQHIKKENDEQHIGNEEYFLQLKDESGSEESKLFAPGRILYFEKNDWCNPVWLTGFHFQKIVIAPSMIADHQPHKIQFMLQNYAQSLCQSSNL